jgi:hypothetical protein
MNLEAAGPMRPPLIPLIAAIVTACLALSAPPAAAQVVQGATVLRETGVFAGPGLTYPIADTLFENAQVIVIERSRVGTWLRVQLPNAARTAAIIDGWVWRGDLAFDPGFGLGPIPISPLPDADLSTIVDPIEQVLSTPPIISPLSEAMRAVFARGQELGNRPNVFTKVGDSLSADPTYLDIISQPDPVLGPYDYLAPTIAYFATPRTHYSVAARRGLTSLVAFDSMWSDPGRCEPGESPVICEYRLTRPLASFILFGPNDQIAMNGAEFEASMRALVEYTLDQGIIPILSTFSFSPAHPRADEAAEFNLILIRLADDYDVPLINLWLAARPLPRFGLEGDDIHMRLSGYRTVMLADGIETRFGGALRNLLSFCMLHEIRLALGLE